MITLKLPLPPSKNKQYIRSARGGVRLDPSVESFRKEVWYAVKAARIKTITEPARLLAVFHPWRDGLFDQANRMDQLLDALQIAGAIENDRLFTDTHSKLGEIVRPLGLCVCQITVIR